VSSLYDDGVGELVARVTQGLGGIVELRTDRQPYDGIETIILKGYSKSHVLLSILVKQ
jgi:hypothetical protein